MSIPYRQSHDDMFFQLHHLHLKNYERNFNSKSNTKKLFSYIPSINSAINGIASGKRL
jgi:hypothetical protein